MIDRDYIINELNKNKDFYLISELKFNYLDYFEHLEAFNIFDEYHYKLCRYDELYDDKINKENIIVKDDIYKRNIKSITTFDDFIFTDDFSDYKSLKDLYIIFNSYEIHKSLSNLPNSLETLTCDCSDLSYINNLPKSLKKISLSYNQLTEFPELPKSIIELKINSNRITTLPNLPDTLEVLNCSNNNLYELPKLPDSLKNLDCANNQIKSINKLPKSLKELYCDDIILPELPEKLEYLEINKIKYTDDELKEYINLHNRKYKLLKLNKLKNNKK